MAKPRRKSRKRSSAQGNKGGFAADESLKEWKPFFRSVLDFFLLLLKLGREFFSLGPREEKKEPSLSLGSPHDASSSSASATISGVNLAANRANEEQPEVRAEEILSFGTVNDKHSCHDPASTGESKKAMDQDAVEAVFLTNGVWVGKIFCPDQGGYQKREEAKVNSLERLHVTDDEEIKSERPGSDSGDWKKKFEASEKQKIDIHNSYDKCKEFAKRVVVLRQVFSNSRKTPLAKIIDDGIKKEVLKLRKACTERIDTVIAKVPYTRILFLMLFQRANIALKSKFCCDAWREDHRFPKFSNDSTDYHWWEENFILEILEARVEILRIAARNWNPELEMFIFIKLVSDLNSFLHREPSGNEFSEKDERQIFEYDGVDLHRTARYLRSSGEQ